MKQEKSFTLIELVIVIGILAIMAAVVVIILNPAQFLKETRDSRRITELQELNKALGLYQADGGSNLGTASTVYVSIPDTSATCDNLGLPTLPDGWSYACVTESNLQNTDGTGWVPVDFSSISFGNALSILPIDPINTTSTGNYYTYVMGGSWKLATIMESEKYAADMNTDGGPDPGLYEQGSDLALAPFQRGLMCYWKFDESSGILYDFSGNDYNGTQSGGVTYGATGKVNTALSFDGSDDYVEVSTSISLPRITVSAWINTTYSSEQYISERSNSSYYFATGVQSGEVCFWLNSVSPNWLCSSVQVDDGNWHYVVGTYDGANKIIYVDGVNRASIAGSGDIGGTSPIQIGVRNNAGSRVFYFNGLIDELRLYNRGLSEAEIQAIYNATQ